MQIRYYKEYSRFLNRFMEFKVYGHAGRPHRDFSVPERPVLRLGGSQYVQRRRAVDRQR